MSDIEDEPPPVLLPCTVCSRTFRPEVLERHVKVCERTAAKKRRVFDSFKNRVSGTELEEFLGPAPLPGQVVKRPVKSPVKRRGPPKWKETHENLIAVLRAARGVNPPGEAVVEAPKPSGNEQCPSCNRFFGPRAFDRHVEFCKEKTARIKMTPSKVSQAQERLEARTKYRAPLSIKPKLTTKEKYSPMLTRKESTETVSSTTTTATAKTSPPIPTLNRSAKQSARQSSSNFSRQSPGRSSERQRSVSPTKKSLVSSSKHTTKSEAQGKASNQPRIKENLRDPDDLRPKTGTKLTTQEKIRSSNLKLTQLEDEIPIQTRSKPNRKGRDKGGGKSNLTSDSESVGTVDSEIGGGGDKYGGTQSTKPARNKWSSSESLNKAARRRPVRRGKTEEEKRLSEEEEEEEKGVVTVTMNATDLEKGKSKTREDSKSAKKSRQKLQINDLSVNDESFGIFVASCQPCSATASKTSLKGAKEASESSKPATKRETRVRNVDEMQEQNRKSELAKTRKKSGSRNREPVATEESEAVVPKDDAEVATKRDDEQLKTKTKPMEKVSRIPKVKHETKPSSKLENETKPVETKPEEIKRRTPVEEEKERRETVATEKEEKKRDEELNHIQGQSCEIKKKSKKWRNISEISTEDLLNMSEDFDVPPPSEEVHEKLSESEIWEIAAEEFLKSEETVPSSSHISVDSLEENAAQRVVVRKNRQGGDDFIVLHVTDPSKLVENDADMKISMSEPCFNYSGKIQKLKENGPGGKKIDIVVFTAFPSALQRKTVHRKRKKQRKWIKPKPIPQLSSIREKTFLTDDLPKAKRRRFTIGLEKEKKCCKLNLDDLKNYFIESTPKEVSEERKKKFIETLKTRRKKIRRWQLTADSHIRYMERFEKSIEDDLKELKNLSKGKKTRRKSSVREFIKQKTAKKECEKSSDRGTTNETSPKCKNKKFEYFEISLDEVISNEEKENRSPSLERVLEKDGNSARDEIRRENKSSSRDKREGGTPKSGSREIKKMEPKTEKESQRKSKKFECFEITNEFSKTTKEANSSKKKDSEKVAEECRDSEEYEETSVEGSVDTTFNSKSLSETEESRTSRQNAYKPKVTNDSKHDRRMKTIKRHEINREVKISRDPSMTDSISCQNSSLENIEEVDEEDEELENENSKTNKKDIEIEDFIISKPDTTKILSKDGNCLDELFPKPRTITETVTRTDSTTAVRLGYTTDSVYDLKSKGEKLNILPKGGNRKSRMLDKRGKKGSSSSSSSELPQILVQNSKKKENSMLSLIELWKTKKQNGDGEMEKVRKTKATLPIVKLTPLSNKNSLQIRGDGGNESYDPFKQAERQMLALLSWPSTVDIKSTKDLSPKPKSNSPPRKTNLETSPTSAFTKYPNKDEKSPKNGNKTGASTSSTRKNLNETFDVNNAETSNKNERNEKPTYTAADDWEEIFEKHFDLNRNEMTEEMTRSMKNALDGLLKNSMKNNSSTGSSDKTDTSSSSPRKSKSEFENSVITEVLYTSTPKQNSKTDRTRTRSKDGSNSGNASLDPTPNTYRKNSDYGRITPPNDFTDSYGKGGGKREGVEKPNRNSGISLSSLSFCSQISDTTLADEEVMRSNLEIIGKAAAAAASRTPRRKYARSQSVFDERNKMLFAKTYDPNSSSSDENDVETLPKLTVEKQGKKSPSRNPHPKPVPSSHFYRSQSVVEDRCKGDGDHSDDGDHISSPERNRKAKMSGDSAYSSLNRRSPRGNVQTNQQEDRLSSSGSETSLPKVNHNYGDLKPKSLDFDGQSHPKKDQKVKMSKFCHECGSKYPVAVAKYCCECGVRRLII